MSKRNALAPTFRDRLHRAVSSARESARKEWAAFEPAAIVVIVYAIAVLSGGLLFIGLLGLLDAMGLLERTTEPGTMPVDINLRGWRGASSSTDLQA